jgi:chemosensory pili system protein ChpA (sensor histidine kinase/response regulator)
MSKPIDQQLISVFVGEAKSYIPKIESAIEMFRCETERLNKIEEMHRYIQNIKGASSMIGVNELSDISNYMEKILEDLASHKIEFSNDLLLFLRNTTVHIGNYLDSLIEGEFDYKTILSEVENSYRRLCGQPIKTNEEVIKGVEKTKQSPFAEDTTYSISKTVQQKVQYPENEPILVAPIGIYKDILNNFKILQDSPERDDKILELLDLVSKLGDYCKTYQFSSYDKATKALNHVSVISQNLCDVVKDLDKSRSNDNYTTLLGITETFIYQIERVLYNYNSDIDFDSEIEQLINNREEYSSSVLKADDETTTSKPYTIENADSDFNPELIAEFLQETRNDSREVGDLLRSYEESDDKGSVLQSVKSYIHKINGAAGMLGFDKPGESDQLGKNHAIFSLTKEMSEYLNVISETDLQLDQDSVQLIKEGTEFLGAMCDEFEIDGLDEILNQIALKFSKATSKIANSQPSVSQDSDIQTSKIDLKPKLKIPDELHEVLMIEAGEHLKNINNSLSDFAASNVNLDLLQEVRRGAHTIKGAASMVGLQPVSDLAHEMEAVLDRLFDNNSIPTSGVMDIFSVTISMLEKLISNQDGADLDSEYNDILNNYKQLELLDTVPQTDKTSSMDKNLLFSEDKTEISETKKQYDDTVEEHFVLSTESSEDIPPGLLDVFLVEANEHLKNMGKYLNIIAKDYDDKESLQEVRRSVHTIKGAAGMVGLGSVSSFAHRMEDLLDNLYEKSVVFNDDILKLLYNTSGLFYDIVNSKVTNHQAHKQLTNIFDEYKRFLKDDEFELDKIDELEHIETTEGFKREDVFLGLDAKQIFELDQTPKDSLERPEQVIRKPGDFVRVPMERLDELVNLVSELVVNRSTFEQHFGVFNQELDELTPSLDRLRRVTSNLETQYEVLTLGSGKLQMEEGAEGNVTNFPVSTSKSHDFDELKFDRDTEFYKYTRELSESTSDIREFGSRMKDLVGDFDGYLDRQESTTSDMQDKLIRLRMVPLATVAMQLHRAVRVTASQQNKKVQLNIYGEEIELDKTVLEKMYDPFFHIIRNSVYHGIELPELRKALNKNEVGTIYLKAYYEGTQVVIQIGDDGAGLVPEVLRLAAVRGGFVSETDSHRLSDKDLYKLIFLPGFTSVSEMSEISGRGVGMDIVSGTVNRLKGTVTIDSIPTKGVTFTIRLPMSYDISYYASILSEYK